jgi:protein-S-isoprenylcysteine O-methyltransferase Ste14
MKLNTSLSVVIRIFLWLFMLFGGAWYSFIQDLSNPYFRNIPFHLISALLGSILIFLAFRASGNGGKELTKGRVGNVPRLETNRLVTTGIYSCMRHPMLFGLTLLPLGWALLLGMPTFITLVAPIEMLFIIVMVIIFEEREVKGKFGDEYEHYRNNVPMVSFEWKCLKQLLRKSN